MPCEKSAASATVLVMEEFGHGTCTEALGSDQGAINAKTVVLCTTEAQALQWHDAMDGFAAAMCKQHDEAEILAATLAAQQAEMEASPMAMGSRPVETEASATILHPQDDAEALAQSTCCVSSKKSWKHTTTQTSQ
ncbi:hypothetical protein Vafri_13321 [Volvox africanus]|nr:hypothetical protein Vafri_13321 [Volvox africanus]